MIVEGKHTEKSVIKFKNQSGTADVILVEDLRINCTGQY